MKHAFERYRQNWISCTQEFSAESYDAASRLTRVNDATEMYQFTYDNMGRLTQTSTAYSFCFRPTADRRLRLDAVSNLTTMTDPQGGDTTYTYDTLNRLATLKNPQRNQFNFTYDALGRPDPTGLAEFGEHELSV